jgi:hypothetical protein
VDADLDTLATALYVRTDDLLKACPERVPWRPPIGIAPKISDAELITLAVMQALLGNTSEARWLRYASANLAHLAPRPASRWWRPTAATAWCTRPGRAGRGTSEFGEQSASGAVMMTSQISSLMLSHSSASAAALPAGPDRRRRNPEVHGDPRVHDPFSGGQHFGSPEPPECAPR